jgi:hypothetical protein
MAVNLCYLSRVCVIGGGCLCCRLLLIGTPVNAATPKDVMRNQTTCSEGFAVAPCTFTDSV